MPLARDFSAAAGDLAEFFVQLGDEAAHDFGVAREILGRRIDGGMVGRVGSARPSAGAGAAAAWTSNWLGLSASCRRVEPPKPDAAADTCRHRDFARHAVHRARRSDCAGSRRIVAAPAVGHHVVAVVANRAFNCHCRRKALGRADRDMDSRRVFGRRSATSIRHTRQFGAERHHNNCRGNIDRRVDRTRRHASRAGIGDRA